MMAFNSMNVQTILLRRKCLHLMKYCFINVVYFNPMKGHPNCSLWIEFQDNLFRKKKYKKISISQYQYLLEYSRSDVNIQNKQSRHLATRS